MWPFGTHKNGVHAAGLSEWVPVRRGDGAGGGSMAAWGEMTCQVSCPRSGRRAAVTGPKGRERREARGHRTRRRRSTSRAGAESWGRPLACGS